MAMDQGKNGGERKNMGGEIPSRERGREGDKPLLETIW